MRNPTNSKTAGGFAGNPAAEHGAHFTARVLPNSSMNSSAAQDAIFERLQAAYRHSQMLASHHLALAERFQTEAEALAELITESETIT